jgi:hypothetical protein
MLVQSRRERGLLATQESRAASQPRWSENDIRQRGRHAFSTIANISLP